MEKLEEKERTNKEDSHLGMKTEEVLGHRDLRKVCSIKKMKRTAKKEKKNQSAEQNGTVEK